ncbi:MAG: LytS/YhcK type 5TM receptor domain-containing protein, partial [Pseudomonadota bacterium]|nr:LytS/YhcK type 5TM receptor domain-containing protein [Pseudomonadota bacterium]
MDTSSFNGLIQNAALLLALGIIYDSLGLQNLQSRHLRKVITGVLTGLVGIALMHSPWEMTPGVFFDTRWILISLSGLFFGFVPTLIAVVMTVTLRITQGGAGMIVGSLVIILPAIIGLVWRHVSRTYKIPYNWWRLYLLGLLVQVTVLCLMLLMPKDMRFDIIRALAPTLLGIFPIGTMLLGMILRRQYVRRKAEQEVLASRHKLNQERSLLRGLLDAIPDHIFVKDNDGRYLAANKAFQEFSQIPEATILGKTDSELFNPRLSEANARIEDRTLNSDKLQMGEVWSVNSEREPRLFEALRAPYWDHNNSRQGLVGINHDITVKRQAEEQILTLSQAVEQSPVSVIITTMNGDIEYVNSHFEKTTGYSKREAIGRNPRFLKSGKTPEGRYQDLWKSILEGKSWQGEFQNQTKDGDIFWERAHIAPVL